MKVKALGDLKDRTMLPIIAYEQSIVLKSPRDCSVNHALHAVYSHGLTYLKNQKCIVQGRSKNLRHFDPGIGLKFAVFMFFPKKTVICLLPLPSASTASERKDKHVKCCTVYKDCGCICLCYFLCVWSAKT